MKTPTPSGLFVRAALVAGLLLAGLNARAQNYPVYDITVPVSPDITRIDGQGRILPTNRSFVIGIDGGTRGTVSIENFTATAAYPLIIVNHHGTGKVFITEANKTDPNNGNGADLTIKNCKYFQVRGDNDPAYRYGIELGAIGTVGGGGLGLSLTGTSSDGEVKFIEVHDVGFAGMIVKSDISCSDPSTWSSNFTIQNINIHDNYVHNTGGEGMYIGSTHWGELKTPCNQTVQEIHHLRVSYNLVENTGWESIQVASNPIDTKLFENVMYAGGTLPTGGQGSNLQIGGGATGEYYNNIMIGCRYDNISIVGQSSAVSIYNNLMADAGDYGIFSKNNPDNPVPSDPNYYYQTKPGSFVDIFNNTIVNPANGSYETIDEQSVNSFRNNICVVPNTAFTEITTDGVATVNADGNPSGNVLVRDTSTLAFADEGAKDYRILPTSAAKDVGVSLAVLTSPEEIPVTADFQNNPRPNGSKYDAGWNETGALSLYLIVTPPTTVGGTGSIKASAIGGTTPYTYVWSNSATTQTITGITEGQYTVTVIDNTGATMTKSTYMKDLAIMGAPVRVVPPTEVLAPTFSVASGLYSTAQLVTLTTGTTGASIRYTTDGSEPTATTGTVYTSAVWIPNTAVIKAVAYKTGMDTSLLATSTYQIDNGLVSTKFTGLVATESGHGSTDVVAHTLDGDLDTHWSHSGDGRWVQYDLGSNQRLSILKMATYNGDVRSYVFDLLVSTDGLTWTTVLDHHHSPEQLGLQDYNLPPIDPVRYVKIVGHGYTHNLTVNTTTNAIAEVELWGGATGTAVVPAFTVQPIPQSCAVGDNITFTATATGAPSPAYQWMVDGLVIPGATSSSFTLSNVQVSDAGTYTVVATNCLGSVTSSDAALTVSSGSLGLHLQAEDGVLVGALVKTNQPDWEGTGFADYINASGDYVEWTASIPSAGSRTLTFRYASTGSARNLEIKVNGTVVNSGLPFTTTGGAGTWALKTTTVTLPSGTVTIRATATGTSGPNIDYLEID